MNEEQLKKVEALNNINTQLILSEKKHPFFAKDLGDAFIVLGEEVGEVADAIYEYTRNGGDFYNIKTEVAQVGAVAIRFLEHLEDLK